MKKLWRQMAEVRQWWTPGSEGELVVKYSNSERSWFWYRFSGGCAQYNFTNYKTKAQAMAAAEAAEAK